MIEIKDLQKTVGGMPALDIPELRVRSGEIAALVGPAGSGKTLLLELLTAKKRPTVGSIRLAGHDPFTEHEIISRETGVLFGEDGVYLHLSPLANLQFHCRIYGLPQERAAEVLALVGLGDQGTSKLKDASSSALRRLAFGRILLHAPAVLLLFEPFNRCNQSTIGLLSKVMRAQADEGKSLLILTTDQSSLTPLCDTIHVLSQGHIEETFHPQEEGQPTFPFKIPARLPDKTVVLVNPPDIFYAFAEGGRAFLVTSGGRLPTQFTLSELEQRLTRSGFFRAHRGFLVNLQHVLEVIPYTRDSFSLRLVDDDHTEIPLSKSAAAELSDLLGY